MDSKTYLRAQAKLIRKQLDTSMVSANIVKLIRESKAYLSAQNVMLFYPKKYEINLLPLLEDNKDFYLPKVCGDDILVCPYNSGDRLAVSNFNIQEPCSNPVAPEILDLIFVPALMTDKQGYRLGYGGGFYDRFLAKYRNIKTITPIASKFIVNKLPIDVFDCRIDEILSC